MAATLSQLWLVVGLVAGCHLVTGSTEYVVGEDDDGEGGDGSTGEGAGPTGSTSDTATSSSASTSSSGSGGSSCVDNGAGELEAPGQYLGPIDDDDSSGGTETGKLVTADEQDWYYFDGVDILGYVVDPTAAIAAESAPMVCLEFECKSGSLELTCPAGSDPWESVGCCASASLNVPSIKCAGSTSDDDMRVYIVVFGSPLACMPYTLSYHF